MRVISLFPLVALAACSVSDAADRRDGGASGPRATRSYALSGFDKVALAGSDDVEVRVGPGFAVRAEAPQAVLDRLDIFVKDGTLSVGRKRDGWNWGGVRDHARISVTMPRIATAVVAGSGDMTVDRAAGGAFTGVVTGSGDLGVAAVDTRVLELHVSGSGDVTARGHAASGSYSVVGSGGIRAGDLATDALTVSVAGSGAVDARSKGEARVSIVGSGDVSVAGATCRVSNVGSGSARCG